jgi:hypothetical protein
VVDRGGQRRAHRAILPDGRLAEHDPGQRAERPRTVCPTSAHPPLASPDASRGESRDSR